MDDQRCSWVGSDPLMIAYHDTEWGVPVHDDEKLFEFMVLDAMQAGLIWRIVLKKRENFEKALEGFDLSKIAKYGDRDLERLVTNAERSEEHTSELQSRQYLVCRLLLE